MREHQGNRDAKEDPAEEGSQTRADAGRSAGGVLAGYSVAEIVENYALELSCSVCCARFTRTIGFVREHARMTCPACGAITQLNVAQIRREVRHVERQMAELHQQLIETLSVRAREWPDEESLPRFEMQKQGGS